MALDGTYLRELFTDRPPVLFFRVFENYELVASTADTVSWRARVGSTELRIQLNLQPISQPEKPAPFGALYRRPSDYDADVDRLHPLLGGEILRQSPRLCKTSHFWPAIRVSTGGDSSPTPLPHT